MVNLWCSVCFVFSVCALWGTVERKGIPLKAASVEGVVVLCSPLGPPGSFLVWHHFGGNFSYLLEQSLFQMNEKSLM